MKFLHLTTVYPSYAKYFYTNHPGIEEHDYEIQKKALDEDAFAWADFWSHALRPLGYEARDISYNLSPLQQAWWRENVSRAPGPPPSNEKIVLEQAKRFRPDILWFDDSSEPLLRRLLEEVPSIRLVLGWTGSALPPDLAACRHVDLMLSCAQESVEHLRAIGLAAEQLHHGFDSRVLGSLRPESKSAFDVTFVGQILRGSQFHDERSRLLEQLSKSVNLAIFSDQPSSAISEAIRNVAKSSLFYLYRSGKAAGMDSLFDRVPILRNQKGRSAPPKSQRNPNLAPFLRPASYGINMYQVIRDSRVSLNIHADSSPRFASNMRLFEATGVGTCLLTDWRENLGSLFRLEEEVVSYKSPDECREKARWLLDHPIKAAEIGQAGQRRTLKDHSYAVRATKLDGLIRKWI